LVYLILHRAAPQSRQHLAFLLWPDSTEAQARTNLRYLLHQLRHALPAPENFLAADAQTLQWRADGPFSLDVDDFNAALPQATGVPSLREVIELYHGDLLPSCYDDWILPERERLRQMFDEALGKLTRLLEAEGDYHAAIQYTQLLLRQDSLREETYRQLMRLHALSGDPSGVLRVYQTCVTVLKRELDAEVSAATRAVYEQLLKTDARPEPGGVPSVELRHHNLPFQLTSFIGREKEISEIKRLLATTRLLTLTGAGGTGKTRLSLQVAAEFLNAFADGVWFIELAPLSDPVLVPVTIASVLGVREESGRPLIATLLDWLRPKQLLLILDNCEHLIEACARLADVVLHAVPQVKILTSSREALSIGGESAWRVPSLPTPNPREGLTLVQLEQYAAVRLFSERATQSLATFRLTSANASMVAQICYRLDGIPLAIELAATRVKAMRVEQIAARLDDCFHLLTGGSRTALARHQTLRATMDWSYSLLTEPERVVLRRLSVFVGGWTLEASEEVASSNPVIELRQHAEAWSRRAGEQVASDRSSDAAFLPLETTQLSRTEVLDLLTHLVDKSLVMLDEQAAEPRYRMLETMRQYTHEKLLESNETNAIRDRHLSFCLRLAENAEPHLSGPAQATWFDRLENDYANLRAAHEWSLQAADASHAMRLASALARLWNVRGPATEGVDWLVRAVSRPEAATPSIVRANALLAAAHFLRNMGELVRSNRYGEESLTISRALEYLPGVARALLHLGVNARLHGDLKTSISLLEQSLTIREGLKSGDVVFSFMNLGLIAEVGGDYDAARKYFEQAMTLAQVAESSHSVAVSLAYLGILAFLQRDYEGAEATLEQGLNAGRAIGSKAAVSMSSRGLAYVALQRGHVERAAALCLESLLTNRERWDSVGIGACLAAFAALAIARGQPERAARLYGSAAARLVGNVGGRHRYPHDQAEQERHINMLRAQLDAATFKDAWQTGYPLTLDQAIEYALESEKG
jgi:predicted ATPase/DNA-binding SARP family transcriptional activator